MTSELVRLGNFIELYDELNQKGEFFSIDKLQGINNEKYFQECQSNKNDINLLRYRICRKGMFSYNKATSRNGEKISIAYRDGEDCLVSPSYICFFIKDESVLLHEYLLLFFCQPVFDRYVRFNSWGSATEFFTWENMCDVLIPLPSIEEQRKIVQKNNVIVDRINSLIKENEIIESFLSSVLDLSLSNDSEVKAFNDIAVLFDSVRKPISGQEREEMIIRKYPYYGAASLMDYVEDYIFDGIYGLIAEDGSCMDENGLPTLQYVFGQFWVNNHAHIFKGKDYFTTEMVYLLLKRTNVSEIITGAVQQKINQENLLSLEVEVPSRENAFKLSKLFDKGFDLIRQNRVSIEKLKELKRLVISIK